MWRWLRWFLLAFVILAICFVGLTAWGQNWHLKDIDPTKVPQFIQADFIDVTKLSSVSKFRSGVGHDASDSVENCRSMRHYFGFMDAPEVQVKEGEDNVQEKAKFLIDTFSPVDGRVMGISGDITKHGQQINIKPDNYPSIQVRIDNLNVDPSIHSLSRLKAGQKIGESRGMAEITLSYNSPFGNKYNFSYFKLMPDSLFFKYQKAAGWDITRDDFIITKEYRDTHPIECDKVDTEKFIISPETETEYNYVYLNGYLPNKLDDKKVAK